MANSGVEATTDFACLQVIVKKRVIAKIWKGSRYRINVILIKSWKDLELVMLEMFVMQHTSIWPNFILIVTSIM